MTGQLSRSMQIKTSSRQYKCEARNNYVGLWYWTPISWTSSDHGDYRDVSFSLTGNWGFDDNRRRSLIELPQDITEKFSVMGTIFNPAVREATGSLYKLHSSEIEHTSFPPIAALNPRYTKFTYRSEIKWAALRTGQDRSINSIARGCTEKAVLSSIKQKWQWRLHWIQGRQQKQQYHRGLRRLLCEQQHPRIEVAKHESVLTDSTGEAKDWTSRL